MERTIPNTTTGNVLAEAARAGVSPVGLASRTGIPLSTMYRRLHTGRWQLGDLEAIAAALDVPLSTLTGERAS